MCTRRTRQCGVQVRPGCPHPQHLRPPSRRPSHLVILGRNVTLGRERMPPSGMAMAIRTTTQSLHRSKCGARRVALTETGACRAARTTISTFREGGQTMAARGLRQGTMASDIPDSSPFLLPESVRRCRLPSGIHELSFYRAVSCSRLIDGEWSKCLGPCHLSLPIMFALCISRELW